MKRRNNTITKAEFSKRLFIASYVLLVFGALLSQLGVSSVMTRMVDVICVVLAYFSLFLTLKKITLGKLFAIAAALMLSACLIFATSMNSSIIQLFAFALAAKNIKMDKLVKLDLILKILLVALVFSFERLGIIQTREFLRDGVGSRSTFGFRHPNFAGLIFLNIYLDIINIRKDKKLTNTLIAVPFYILISAAIDSRSASIGIVIAAIIQWLKIEKVSSIAKKLVPATLIITMSIISFYFMVCQMSPEVRKLDIVLSGRIRITRAFYSYYGVNLFGHEFEKYNRPDLGDQFYVIDNAYAFVLIHNGVMILVGICMYYIGRIKASLRGDHDELFAALVAFAFVGLMERAMLQPLHNPFLAIDSGEENKR